MFNKDKDEQKSTGEEDEGKELPTLAETKAAEAAQEAEAQKAASAEQSAAAKAEERKEKLEMPGLLSFIRENWNKWSDDDPASGGETPGKKGTGAGKAGAKKSAAEKPSGFFDKLRALYGDYREVKERHSANLETYELISESAVLSKEFFVLLIGSNIIATFGLFANSTAVIIGAMLIAPLMMPILGFALGTLWGDRPLISDSITTLFTGSLLALAISAAFASLIPGVGITPEILGRTKPNLYDIIIAVASGMVGAYAFVNPRIAGSISGVAIAVALMPPLCTIGICLGLGKLQEAFGAGLLYLTNLVGISMAASFVFWRLKVHPVTESDQAGERAKKKLVLASIILVIIGLPLGYHTWQTVILAGHKAVIRQVIRKEAPGSQIMNLSVTERLSGPSVRLTMIVPPPAKSEMPVEKPGPEGGGDKADKLKEPETGANAAAKGKPAAGDIARSLKERIRQKIADEVKTGTDRVQVFWLESR